MKSTALWLAGGITDHAGTQVHQLQKAINMPSYKLAVAGFEKNIYNVFPVKWSFMSQKGFSENHGQMHQI